ncbi:MAG: radical SAM protein [Candidatus Aureabacteria bacterium]|nr:radical SAM protein [Candidatus Auribacterota bacterium]
MRPIETRESFKKKLEFEILPFVEKPERYIGREGGTVIKGSCKVHFCLVFAESYEIGMSNLGLHILYSALNKRDDTLAEYSFCPWKDMESVMAGKRFPLFSYGTYTPLDEFDIIGISVPHEMCYTNIFTILSLSGIPLKRSERSLLEHPLVIGGGALACNPSPVEKMFDMIVIGEGENVIHEIINTYNEHVDKKPSLEREDFVRLFGSIEGVYVPGGKKPVSRVFAPSIETSLISFPVIANTSPVHDRCVVEIARGCPWGCRYCQAGYVYRPYREKKTDNVLQEARLLLNARGEQEISFLSLSSSDYKNLKDIILHFKNQNDFENMTISFPSMRIERSTLDVVRSIYSKKKPTITLAPEAGSERMLRIIGKKVNLKDFIDISSEIYKEGWQGIKLYFMIGLPFESDDDLMGICHLIQSISLARKAFDGKMGQLNVTVSSFIPKPHTPFQWARQNYPEEIRRKQAFLKKNVKNRFVTLKFQPPWQTLVEGLLSRGDEKIFCLLEKAWEKGARFDNWSEAFQKSFWEDSLTELSIPVEGYLEEKLTDRQLPWENIQMSPGKAVLQKEWEKAKNHAFHT